VYFRPDQALGRGLVLIAIVWISLGQGLASTRIDLSLGKLEGPGWGLDAAQAVVRVDAAASPAVLEFSASELHVDGLREPVSDIELLCQQAQISDGRVDCSHGRLSFRHPAVRLDSAAVQLHWDRRSGELDLGLSDARVVGGRLDLELQRREGVWQLEIGGRGMSLAELLDALRELGIRSDGGALSGRADLAMQADWPISGRRRVRGTLACGGCGFSDPTGRFVAENLTGDLQGDWLQSPGGGWQAELHSSWRAGDLLTPFAFVSAEKEDLDIDLRAHGPNDGTRIELARLSFVHANLLSLDASGSLDLEKDHPWVTMSLRTEPADLARVYREYARPLVAATALERLDVSGIGSLRFELSAQASHAELDVDDAAFVLSAPPLTESFEGQENAAPRDAFSLGGVTGRLIWTRGVKPERSSMSWTGGKIFGGLPVGPGRLEMELDGSNVRVVDEAEIPLLDGALLVHDFELKRLTGDEPDLSLSATLTPISMEMLSGAFGWPVFQGKVSGVIPGVRWGGRGIDVSGNLLVRAFDGDIVIRDLKLDDPLGVWPVVTADAEVVDLDLALLTGAFSFGKITGRLSGEVRGVVLENWVPTEFDARLATPKGDDSRHRISQRAVENIADLGGSGLSGALSRGLLRYFDEFGYARLGISCRLENGICAMGGVAPAEQGYYLVEGRGLPRIDVIGFNDRADWIRLVDQLRSIRERGESSTSQDSDRNEQVVIQ